MRGSDQHILEDDPVGHLGWRLVFSFTTKKHLPILCGALLCAAVAALTVPAQSIMYGLVFDQFAHFGAGKTTSAALLANTSKYCTYMTAIASVNWATNSLHMTLWLMFGELQARRARDETFDQLLTKDIAWYDTRRSGVGALLAKLQMQVRDLQLATSQPMGAAAQCAISGVSSLVIAFLYSWKLTLVITCTVPAVYIFMAFLSTRLARGVVHQTACLQEALNYATNAFQNIETVKCFNGERVELHKFGQSIARAAKYHSRQANLRSIQLGFMQCITLSMFVQGFWYGSSLIAGGKRSPGQVMTTFWAALMAVQSITGFLPQWIILEKGRVAAAHLKAVELQVKDEGRASVFATRQGPRSCSGDIEFKQVSFSYPALPDQLALCEASLFFPAGEFTFVVGRSGSGKSTLGQLAVRFYDPSHGQVCLDGAPLQTLDVSWLRSNVTLVEQHAVLFNDTIQGNIALAKPNGCLASLKEIENAVEFALLRPMINDLPEGLNTSVGAKGYALSGGQRQRLALARARLRDTPVLILDESTSALDYANRAMALDAIRTWRRGKTTIIITHDIAQVLPDDYVYVLDKSRVVQEGYRSSIENDHESPFHGLLTSVPSEAEPPVGLTCDSTDDLLSLYASGWGDRRGSGRSWNITPTCDASDAHFSMQIALRRKSAIPQVTSPYWGLLSTTPDTAGSRLSAQANGTQEQSTSFSKRAVRRDSQSPAFEDTFRNLSISTGRTVPLEVGEGATYRSSTSRQQMRSSKGQPRRSGDYGMHSSGSAKRAEDASVLRILSTVWPRLDWLSRLVLQGAIFAATVHAAATPAFSVVFSRLLSTFYSSTNQHRLALLYSLAILGIALVDGAATYCFHFFFDRCAQSWINQLKLEAMKLLLQQPRSFFNEEENSVSRLTECLGYFAEEARNILGRFIGVLLVVISMMTIAVAWSMFTCWKLTLIAIATAPLLYAVTASYKAICTKWEGHSNDADEEIGTILHETFTSIRTVRCLVLEDAFRDRHSNATAKALKMGIKRAIYCGSFYGLNFSVVLFLAAFLFWYGARTVASGQFGTSNVVQTFTLLLLSTSYANFVVSFVPQLSAAKDGATRLLRLANLSRGSHELQGNTRMSSPGTISFNDVEFSYPSRRNHPVLRGLSLHISSGSCIAIVGASGSGKSTVASLLTKLYHVDPSTNSAGSHAITISGHDIGAIDTPSLRALIAVVSQTPVLFPGTIAENIAYGLSHSSSYATLDAICAAAHAAGIDEFITTLPSGFETMVGEGGTAISGGQAQRIAIARALVREPQVLILDEATSALDMESARIVRDTVARLVTQNQVSGEAASWTRTSAQRKAMLVIVITHAREMMAIAERIIVVDTGRVAEEGTFEELKRRGGAFSKLLLEQKS